MGSRLHLLSNTWHRDNEPFNLNATVASGQVFRWRRDDEGVWWGAVEDVVIGAYQEHARPYTPVQWQTFPCPDRYEVFEQFFRLDVELEKLYCEWIDAEPAIQQAIESFRGLRILGQPPVECFFAFQCASCNTIVKIERSVRLLAMRYGAPIDMLVDYGAQCEHYRFPTIAELALAEEHVLRSDLWGYRAPRVIDLAQRLVDSGAGWLEGLRSLSYSEARDRLEALPGIGPKVADCICLFGLGKDEAVPIDTHTRQIGVRIFDRHLAAKSLTTKVYNSLAESYRSRFGAYAGWAQQYLFFGELRQSRQFAILND